MDMGPVLYEAHSPTVMPYNRSLSVTSEKLCRAQHELHFQAATYLCLLRSTREHVALHQEFHGKGERSVEESAGLVGLKLPQQPGGKGWEP
nr:protein FMC1 homolog [Manis javanica]